MAAATTRGRSAHLRGTLARPPPVVYPCPMFGLTPLLLPLQTLPGWPEAPVPTLGEGLIIMLGIPGAIGVLITAMIMGPLWLKRSRDTGAVPSES